MVVTLGLYKPNTCQCKVYMRCLLILSFGVFSFEFWELPATKGGADPSQSCVPLSALFEPHILYCSTF